jgi:hypothetical protein
MSDVRPESDIVSALDVRFTPESGHCRTTGGCPLCAKSGLMQCSNRQETHAGNIDRISTRPVAFKAGWRSP